MKKNYLLLFTAFSFIINNKSMAQCLDQPVSPVSSSIICNGSGTIVLASSEAGVNYYVRNDANNAVVTGPVAGTGSSLALGTGSIGTSMIYNIRAVKATKALAFDGVDDYVEISNGLNSNGNFTWEAWIKTGTDGTIFSKTTATGVWASGSKSLFVRNGKITFEVFGQGSFQSYSVYNDNNWHHVAITNEVGYLGGTDDRVRMYVDGVFTGEKNNWNVNGNSETGLINRIGYTNSDFPAISVFKGIIDEVKIWSTVRTATEVTGDMTSCLTGMEAGLMGYYQFENGTGTVLTDVAGADNNGTLTNMSSTAWVYGRDECGTCNVQLSQKPVFVVTAIADQTLTAASPTLCSNVSTSINLSGSEAGVNYYLRNNASFSVITGPVAGTGSSLGINTGVVANTTTYNVIAVRTTGALSFDGVDDYVLVRDGAALESLGLSVFTMESWIYPTNVTSARSVIRKDGDYNLYINNGFVVAEAFTAGGNGGAFMQATSSVSVSPNVWTHVAAVWNGTGFTIYINGVSSALTNNSSTSAAVSKLCIGKSKSLGQPFAGKIEELRLWSSVRSVSQLTANINSCLTGTETSLIAYYQFEDGNGSAVLTDKSVTNAKGYLADMDNVSAWTSGMPNCGCSLQLGSLPVVTANSSPTVSVNSGSVCSGSSFSIVPSGANNYTITGGSFNVSPGTTTSYSVTGTNNGSGCVSQAAVATISVSATPTVSAGSFSICSGSSVTIVPSGANSYTITGGTFTVSPSATTAYSVTGTSTAGCVSSAAVANVSVSSTPTISVSSGVVCPGNSFTLTPSGASSYTYSGGSNVVTPGSTTSYTITGASAQGCQAANTAVATVSVVNTLTITISGSTTVCSGQSTTLTANGASTYTWNGTVVTNTLSVTPTSTSTYTVMGASGNCSNTAVVSVSVNPVPVVTVNSGSVCSGESFTVVPSGAVSYTYSGGSSVITPTSSLSYSVTGSSALGCISSNTAVGLITVNSRPSIVAVTSTSVICLGENAVLSAIGGTSYTWSDAQTGGSITITPTAAALATYTVTGSGANGCTSTATVGLRADACTKLNNIQNSALIFGVYPNPNAGRFVVEAGSGVTITIINALGSVVYTEKTSDAKTSVSIEHLANGVYFIKAAAGGQQQIVKIIKE